MDSKQRDELRKLTNEVIMVRGDDLYCIGYFYNTGIKYVKFITNYFNGPIHIDVDYLRVEKQDMLGYFIRINESGSSVFSSVHKEEVDYVLKLILVHKVDIIFQ